MSSETLNFSGTLFWIKQLKAERSQQQTYPELHKFDVNPII